MAHKTVIRSKKTREELENPNKINKAIKFLDDHSIWYSILLLVLVLVLASFTINTETTYTSDQQLVSFLMLAILLFVPFHLGVKKGADLHRPRHWVDLRKTLFSRKQLDEWNTLAKQGKEFVVSIKSIKENDTIDKTEP